MISKDKKYRTTEGGEVVLYEFYDGFWHGRCLRQDYAWVPCKWNYDGKCSVDNLNLVEDKPRIQQEVWINVYDGDVVANRTRELADKYAGGHRLACVKIIIDCEHGDGL